MNGFPEGRLDFAVTKKARDKHAAVQLETDFSPILAGFIIEEGLMALAERSSDWNAVVRSIAGTILDNLT